MNSQKASILLYIVLLLSLLLTVVLGLSALITSQFAIMRGIGNSIVAFYAADAGVERMLNSIISNNETLPNDFTFAEEMGNGASYSVTIYCRNGGGLACAGITEDATCDADNFCIKSEGEFNLSKRAIMVKI